MTHVVMTCVMFALCDKSLCENYFRSASRERYQPAPFRLLQPAL